jgi:hypothetical protein
MITRHEVAVEEAAHAVALVHFGWQIREVTIVPDARYDGRVSHYGQPPDAAPIENYVISAIGYAARRQLAGGQDPEYFGSLEDFAYARRQLEADIPDMRARLAVTARGDLLTRGLVVMHWPLIEALAARLERDRRLCGKEVLRFIQEH